MPIIIISLVLFILALAGGFFAVRSLNKKEAIDVTQNQLTYAWAPSSVAGTCSGGRVIGNTENVAYDYDFTFSLASNGRNASVQHSFHSKQTGNTYKVDEDFTWASLGPDGVAFASLLRTGDRVNWTVKVRYTQNGQAHTEDHGSYFTINDTTCGTASPAPVATATPAPTATPRVTATPAVTAAPTATPVVTNPPVVTATPRPTATPTTPPEASGTPIAQITPSPSPRTDLTDNKSDNKGCSVQDCSGNKKNDSTTDPARGATQASEALPKRLTTLAVCEAASVSYQPQTVSGKPVSAHPS
jgi:hypothetical protein